MHARIDVLTHPRFWSLLPSTILDWVVIIVSISPSVDAPKHADISRECNLEYFGRRLHRTNLLSVGAHEHCSGCTSLHLRKRIATGATHHPPAWNTSHIYAPYTQTCTPKHTCVHRCTIYTYMHHIHIHAPNAPPNTYVCIDTPYTHTCTTCTHVHHIHCQLQMYIYAPFTHTCTTKHRCVHRCTIYTNMHHMHTCAPHASLNTYVYHQTPPKVRYT